MRLVVYVETEIIGGAEIVTGHLVENLRADIEVCAMGPSAEVVEYLAGRRPGSRAVVVPPLRSKRELSAFPAHRRVLRSLAPGVFHAVMTFQTACFWPIIAAGTVRGIAPIAVEHLEPIRATWRDRAAKRRALRFLAAHIAVGSRVARDVERDLRLPPGTVRTIYNGLPDVTVSPAPIPGAGTTVGVVAAHLTRRKGIDVLLHALADLPQTQVAVVGRGPEEERLRALARDLGVEDRVQWLGWFDAPRPYIAAFDVLAVPSRAEAFPLVIVEAMLASRPVVASAVGSVPEAVTDGVTGALVPPDDPDALAGALTLLLADPDLRQRMGAAGRRDAIERFSVETMTRTYEQLYDEIAQRDVA
ncbi:MAG TPA: glycosyltransferase [Acidimicrobiia bacterium]